MRSPRIARMPPPVLFYMDDSGTRTLDREPTAFVAGKPNHFALGGVLILEEHENEVRAAHQRLCEKWKIDYPLHSVDIRAAAKKFGWVRRESADYAPFMRDLTRFLTEARVTALACVVDRPGYDARYRELYPRSTWHLCRTAFSIAVERAAKYARGLGRPLRVYPEQSARDDEKRLRAYYKDLLTAGLPFDPAKSGAYAPLKAHELNETLIELRFKAKTSPIMQVADLYLWPVAMYRYGEALRPYGAFKEAGRLIENHLADEQVATRGTKYSCFQLVDAKV